MRIQPTLHVAILFALSACTSSPSVPPPTTSSSPVATVASATSSGSEPSAPSPSGPEASAPSPGASADKPAPECRAEQFVACHSGAESARRGGKLVQPQPCHDHAADACNALGCAHGCNIHNGDPKEVHCAANASSSSNMRRCAGFSGWGCPENKRCEVTSGGFDAIGTCVAVQ